MGYGEAEKYNLELDVGERYPTVGWLESRLSLNDVWGFFLEG